MGSSTDADLSARKKAVLAIVERFPRTARRVLIEGLPDNFGSVSSQSQPAFYSVQENSLTWQEVWDFQSFCGSQILDLAEEDPSIVSEALNRLVRLREPSFASVETCVSAVLSNDGEDARKLWLELDELVAHHQSYPDAEWSLDEDKLFRLKTLLEEAVVADSVVRHVRTFGWDREALAEDSAAAREELKNERQGVLLDIFRNSGAVGLTSFAGKVKQPILIPILLAEILPFEEMLEICRQAKLSELRNWLSAIGETGAHSRESEFIPWVSGEGSSSNLSQEELIEILSGTLRTPSARAFVWTLDQEIQNKVWSESRTRASWIDGEDRERAIDSWIKASCAHRVIEESTFSYDSFATATLRRLAEGAIEELNNDIVAKGGFSLRSFLKLLEELRDRDGVEPIEIVQLEMPFIRVAYSHRTYKWQAHSLLKSDPTFFIDCIKHAYKNDRALDQNSEAEGSEEDDAGRGFAKTAFYLLYHVDDAGFVSDGVFDIEAFRSWHRQVMTLAADAHRVTGAEITIGKILAHTPADTKDDVWPSIQVSEAIELMASVTLERSISTTRANMRRAFSGSGEQHYKRLSEKLLADAEHRKSYPRTFALLKMRASQDQFYAEWSRTRDDEENSQSRI